jgi:hypothetical protein
MVQREALKVVVLAGRLGYQRVEEKVDPACSFAESRRLFSL